MTSFLSPLVREQYAIASEAEAYDNTTLPSLFLSNPDIAPLCFAAPLSRHLTPTGLLNYECFSFVEVLDGLVIPEHYFLKKRETDENNRTFPLYEHVTAACRYLKRVALSVHAFVACEWLTEARFRLLYERLFGVVSDPGIFVEIFVLHRESLKHSPSHGATSDADTPCGLLPALLVVALVDRILGNIARHLQAVTEPELGVSGQKKKVRFPTKFRDLLEFPIIQQTLGEEMVFLMRMLIAFPLGINVKNLVWHGFLCESELVPAYTSLCLVLALTLADQLYTRILKALPHSGPNRNGILNMTDSGPTQTIAVPNPGYQAPLPKLRNFTMDRTLNAIVLDAIENVPRNSILDLLQGTDFISSTRKSIVFKAIDCYFSGRQYHFLTLICPEIENGLRNLYAQFNNLPSASVTAECEAKMITMVDIIADHLKGSAGEPNALCKVLGPILVHAMLELFLWTAGPGVRDKISHGTTDARSIPGACYPYVLGVLLLLCHAFSTQKLEKFSQLDTVYQSSYQIQYNPLCQSGRYVVRMTGFAIDLLRLLQSEKLGLEDDSSDAIPSADGQCTSLTQLQSINSDLLSRIESILVLHQLERVRHINLALKMPCAWRRDQMIILSLVEEVGRSATLLHQSLLLQYGEFVKQFEEKKKLSARQKSSYTCLRANLDLLAETFHFFSFLCEYCIVVVRTSADDDEIQNLTKGLKFFQQRVVSLVVSLISSDKKMYKMALGAFLVYLGCVGAHDNPNANMVQAATRKQIEHQYRTWFS